MDKNYWFGTICLLFPFETFLWKVEIDLSLVEIYRNWELTAPWTGVKIQVPVKFIVGDMDLSYHMGSNKNYIHKGGFKRDVPFLQDLVVMKGAGHFINQERPNEVSDHIYDFIQKFNKLPYMRSSY